MTASRWWRLQATLAGFVTLGLVSASAALLFLLPPSDSEPTPLSAPLSAPPTTAAPLAFQTPPDSPSATPTTASVSPTATAKPKPSGARAEKTWRPAARDVPARSARSARQTPPPPPKASPSASTSGSGSAVERQTVQLTNAERTEAGCEPVRTDSRLVAAAGAHSADMATRHYFSHTSPEGLTFVDRAKAAGYPSPGGENIAWGQPTAAAVVADWMGSPGHRRNILNCDFTAIGVGFDSRGNYWTEVFGY